MPIDPKSIKWDAPANNWQVPKDVQMTRDQERLKILSDELAQTTDPAYRAALQREIGNTGKPLTEAGMRDAAGSVAAPRGIDPNSVQWDAPQVQQGGKAANLAKLSTNIVPAAQPPKGQYTPPTGAELSAGFVDLMPFDWMKTPAQFVVGAVRGGKNVVDTGAEYLAKGYDKITGNDKNLTSLITGQSGEAARVKKLNQEGKASYDQYKKMLGDKQSPIADFAGQTTGEIIASNPFVGGAGALVATKAPNLGKAITTYGTSGGNLATRMAGGALSGGIQSGMINPDSADVGALIGGAFPLLGKAAGYGGDLTKNLFLPLTKKGQEKIANETVKKVATNPTKAAEAIRNYKAPFNVQTQTPAAVSEDIGLIGLERNLRNKNPADFVNIDAARNTAIGENLGKYETALGKATQKRSESANVLYEKAREAGIDSQMVTRGTKGEVTKLMQNPYIAELLPKAERFAAAEGITLKNSPSGSIETLHYIKKALDDKIERAAQNGIGKIEQGQIIEARNRLLTLMDRVNPEYAAARSDFALRSKPVNQMEMLAELSQKSRTGNTDAFNNLVISPAQFNKYVSGNKEAMAKTLTPQQLSNVGKISNELNLANRAQRLGKPAGSDTFQNITQDNILKALLGNKLGGSGLSAGLVGKGVDLFYGRPNQRVMDRINALMTSDPQMLANVLMQQSKPGLLQYNPQLIYRAAPALAAQD